MRILGLLLVVISCCWASDWFLCPGVELKNPLLKLILSSPKASQWDIMCLNVTAPLDYSNPSAGDISLFVTKLTNLSSSPKLTSQLWMIAGGPGEAGEPLLNSMINWDLMDALDETFELIFPDHRGTGYSTPLYCPNPDMAHVVECTTYLDEVMGDNLHQFTISNAARDINFLLKMNSGPGIKQHLYGISYGTLLIQRFLLIFNSTEDRPLSVTLDGVVSPTHMEGIDYDVHFNNIGRVFMARCDSDTFCSAAFDGTCAYQKMQELFDALSQGEPTCFDKLTQPLPPPFAENKHMGLEMLFATILEDEVARVLIPPTVFRINRCNSDDIAALNHLMKLIGGGGLNIGDEPLIPADNVLLLINIETSELLSFDTPPDAKTLAEQSMSLYFATFAEVEVRVWYDFWNRYPLDGYTQKVPNVDGLPLLMLNGNLDPATPVYWPSDLWMHYFSSSPLAKFVMLDTSTHGSLVYSPVTNSDTPCGIQVLASWLLGGYETNTVDTTCLSHLAPIDWEGTNADTIQDSITFFGTTDMWQF
ncbi:alpha/beta hydrolase fold [Pelomyxa schiedti]|nr:alpha/beta hydrolase fold [Pelomyxa schiedti]